MADAAPQLQEAYDLIQSGDLPSARQLLDEIRDQNENNPDYWWLYTHAAEDATLGRSALNRVRQLAPNYPGLADLSRELGIAPPQPLPPQSLPPQDTSKPPTLLDDDEFDIAKDDDEFDSLEPETTENNSLMPIVLGIAAVALVVLVALFLINSFTGSTPDATDTPVIADNPTPEPIIPTINAEDAGIEETEEIAIEENDEATEVSGEPVVEETEEIATEEEIEETEETTIAVIPTETPTDEPDPTDVPTATPSPTETATPEPEDPFEILAEDLAAFGVPEEDGIRIEDTDAFGDTYIVTTCSSIGPRATQNIIGIIDTLAPSSEALAEVDGYAFEVTDCETDTVRLTLGIDSETLASYWDGDTSVSQLQAALRRLS